jgi:hypothetical protein
MGVFLCCFYLRNRMMKTNGLRIGIFCGVMSGSANISYLSVMTYFIRVHMNIRYLIYVVIAIIVFDSAIESIVWPNMLDTVQWYSFLLLNRLLKIYTMFLQHQLPI